MIEAADVDPIYDWNTNTMFTASWRDGDTFFIRAAYDVHYGSPHTGEWHVTHFRAASNETFRRIPSRLPTDTQFLQRSTKEALFIMNDLGSAAFNRRAMFLSLMVLQNNREDFNNFKTALNIWNKTFKDAIELDAYLENI